MPVRKTEWEGDAAALVGETNKRFVQGRAAPLQLNERVLRDYVQRGIVARPQRRGKAAIYGARHLMQLIAARTLLGDGWPLAKIAEHMASLGAADLARLAGMKAVPEAGAGLAEEVEPYRARGGNRMNKITVTPKGELTLSREIVEALGVRPGDQVSVEELPGGQVQLRRAPTGKISDFFGILKHRRGRKPVTIEEMNRTIALGWAGMLKPPKK